MFYLIFIINHIRSCLLGFTPSSGREQKIIQVDVDQELYMIGVWTRYYTFYSNQSLTNSAQIFRASSESNNELIQYGMQITDSEISHIITLSILDIYQTHTYQIDDDQYEGVWILQYIKFDQKEKKINTYLLNQKTTISKQFIGQLEEINNVYIYEKFDQNYQELQLFNGQIHFVFSNQIEILFDNEQQIKDYLQSCQISNICLAQEQQILIKQRDQYNNTPFKVMQHEGFWIDGWFKLNIQQQHYFPILLKILQYDRDNEKYNGMTPLYIEIRYNQDNLLDNGFYIQTQYYNLPRWYDYPLNQQQTSILDKQYNSKLQGWVYFRYCQQQQQTVESNHEIYFQFLDGEQVIKQLGQNNLFYYGQFYIYIGSIQSNKQQFTGQMQNIRFKTCLDTYTQPQKTCYSTCLDCFGPLSNECKSCKLNNNRYYDELWNSCKCLDGYFELNGQDQCQVLIEFLKTAVLTQEIQLQKQPCPQGYFQYLNNSLICIQCPNQVSNMKSCGDCLDNLYNWQNTLFCSYDYIQSDIKNVFIKHYRDQIDYYFVKNNELKLCYGCQLCEQCDILQIYEVTARCLQSIIISQQLEFYYDSYQCVNCPFNCLYCLSPVGDCTKCEDGYFLFDGQCIQCQGDCQQCDYQDIQQSQVCITCIDNFSQIDNICQQCKINCKNCQYDDTYNINRCISCISEEYFIQFDGETCQKINIQNCQIQYQRLNQYNTLLIDFPPQFNSEQIIDVCALCDPQYQNLLNSCVFDPNLLIGEQVVKSSGVTTYIISYSEQQYVNTNCLIESCEYCLSQDDQDECILCNAGYYADISSGLCYECSDYLNCNQCYQQHVKFDDGWKWDIRAYISFYHPNIDVSDLYPFSQQTEIVCKSCQQGYEIRNQKCIRNCPNLCAKCTIINDENICTYCGQNANGYQLSIYDNQCIQCPSNCLLCKPRTQQEIYLINPFFQPDEDTNLYFSNKCLQPSNSDNIYYDQQLEQYVKCGIGQFCENQLSINVNIEFILDQCVLRYKLILKYFENVNRSRSSIVQIRKFCNQSTIQKLVKFFFDLGNIIINHKIETPQLISYMNQQQIKSLTYIINLIYGQIKECTLEANSQFYSVLPKNVFSLIFIKLVINGNFGKLIQRGLNIHNFTQIEFHNFTFQLPFDIKFNNPIGQEIIFTSISTISFQNDPRIININVQNPTQITIKSCIFTDLYSTTKYSELITQNQTNNKIKYISIRIEDFILQQANLIQTNFISFKNNIKYDVIINKSQINGIFHNSSIFKEESTSNTGLILISYVNFQIQYYSAPIFYLQNMDLQIKDSNFSGSINQCQFILINTITLQFTMFLNLNLNQASVIDNQFPRLKPVDNKYQFSNINFINISLDDQSNLINIQDNNQQNFLYINDLVITNCYSQEVYGVTKKLIQFQGQEVQIKSSNFSKHLMGLTDFEIKYAHTVIINKVTVSGFQIQGIHESLLCLQKLLKISNSNSFIQFQNVRQILFSNSTFNNIMIQNQAIILINSFDDTQIYNYSFVDLNFQRNLILITDEKSQGSMIQISSPISGYVSFKKIIYYQNVVNEYIQNQIQYSATTILIEAKWFIVDIVQCQFTQNFLFNSSDSIQYIFANKITYSDCKFSKQNVYDDFILNFIIWPLNGEYSIESFQYFYPILSSGGNGQLTGNQIYIKNTTIQETLSQKGAGFYIRLQKYLNIENCVFKSLQNKMDRDDSQGGSLYIETIDGQSSIIIINSQFLQSFSLQDGGAIYIQSKFTECDISISNLTIQDCYSLKGSFLSLQQDSDSLLQIDGLQISNTQSGFNQFLSLFNYISNEQIQQFHQSAYLFYIISGQVTINQLQVSNIFIQGCIYFMDALRFEVYSSSFQNITVAQLGILNIYPSQIMQSKIQLINVKLIDIEDVQSITYNCEQMSKVYLSQLSCTQGISPKHLNIQEEKKSEILECNRMRIGSFNNPKQLLYIDQVQKNGLNIIEFYLQLISCNNCQNGIFLINQISQLISLVNIKGLKINNCICGVGCLVISNQTQITLHEISKSRILSNLGFMYNINYTLLITESSFLNNTSNNGAVIVNQLNLLVENCLFMNNNSTQTGGAISFLGQFQLNIFDTQFINNQAQAGAAIYSNNIIIPNLNNHNTQFINNQATLYGNALVNEPSSLRLSVNEGITLLQNQRFVNSSKQIIDQVIIKPYRIFGNNSLQKYLILPSGQKIDQYQYYNESNDSYIDYNLSLRVIALNEYEDLIQELNNTSCFLKSRVINISNINESIPFDSSLISQSKFDFNSTTQDYNLDSLIIKFDPQIDKDFVLQLQIICNSVKIPIVNLEPPYNVLGSHSNYELRVNIRTFDCQVGEAYNKYQGVCSLCDSSQQFYSVQKGNNKCDIKDDVQMISVSSTKINLKESYWRPYDNVNKIEYCFHLEKNCKGGWITGDGSCEIGHIGALCEQCDLYDLRGNGSYAISGSYQCGPCINVLTNAITIVIICCWTLISIFISVKGTLDLVEDLIFFIKATKIGFVSSISDKGTIAILVKILTNYLQIISAIATFQLRFPPGLNDAFSYSGNPIKSLSYSLDCFLTDLSDIEILYFRTIWSLFMPFLYASVIFIVYFLMILSKYQKFNLSVLSTTLIYIYIYLQPDIIGGLISLISYRNISGILWVQGNVSYLYMTPTHLKWLLALVMPAFIFIGIVIPTLLFLKLSQRKDKLDQVETLKMFGYLYNEYSKNAYYWEILKICQKELMIVFLIFYEDLIVIKGTLVFVIIFVYDLFTKTQKPYKRKDLNTLDEQNNFVCAFSVVLGMSIYVATNNGNSEIIWPFFVLLGIANILFLIKLAFVLIVSYLGQLRPILDKIREYIKQNFPDFVEKYPQFHKYLVNSQEREKRVRKRFQKIKNCVLPYAKMVVNLKRHQKLEQARQSMVDLPQLDLNETVVRKNSFRIFDNQSPNQNNYQIEQVPALTAKPQQQSDAQSLIQDDILIQFDKTSKFQKSDNYSEIKNPESRFLPQDEEYQINDEK